MHQPTKSIGLSVCQSVHQSIFFSVCITKRSSFSLFSAFFFFFSILVWIIINYVVMEWFSQLENKRGFLEILLSGLNGKMRMILPWSGSLSVIRDHRKSYLQVNINQLNVVLARAYDKYAEVICICFLRSKRSSTGNCLKGVWAIGYSA